MEVGHRGWMQSLAWSEGVVLTKCDGTGSLPRSMMGQDSEGRWLGLCPGCAGTATMTEVVPPSNPKWKREFRLDEHEAGWHQR